MGTNIRPKLSARNKYWINTHRYYELKHFCLQYQMWKKAYQSMDDYIVSSYPRLDKVQETTIKEDTTSKYALIKAHYWELISMVENAALEADRDLSVYILKAVTEGFSYPYLKARLNIPCSKDTYYDRYRKFFWILNKLRD